VDHVTHPVIGVDVLSNFGLLVDCRNNRLLDGVTSLFVPGQAANARIPSVTTVTGGTPIDGLLAEFPDFTRPARVQREIRHNTIHHIRTIPGPPVTCRPRRLTPDRLAIAKAEFDAMLLHGIARRSESSWSSALHINQRWITGGVPVAIKKPSNTVPFPTVTPSGISMITPTSFSVFQYSLNRPGESLQPNPHPSPAIYKSWSLPLHSAYSSSPACLSVCATPPRHFNDSWTTFCGDDFFSRSLEHEQYLRALFTQLQRCGIIINPAKCVLR
jgi:cleavage and polyadenylation specificity factor subunit 1